MPSDVPWNAEEGGNDGEDTPSPTCRRQDTEADRHDLRGEDAGRDRGAVRDQPDRRADRHARIGARGDAPGERSGEPRQHRLGAGHRVPRLLHASRVHGVGSRLRPVARDGERPHRMHRRHVPVRPPVLGVRVRVHVRRRQRPDRLAVLPPARRAGHLRLDRRGVPGVLAVPVRVRRHVLHDHVGRHGRSHGIQGRPALLDRGLRVHLPDLRSLGMGSGRLARQHDAGLPQQLHGRDRVPRLRGLDRGAHRRWLHRARQVRSSWARGSAAGSSGTVGDPSRLTT